MGACISRRQQHEHHQYNTLQRPVESVAAAKFEIKDELTSRTTSSEYNKLLMEHLEKNKESLDVIAKSLTALSTINLNTPKSIRSNSINNYNNNNNTSSNVNKNEQIVNECNCKRKTKTKNLKLPCSKVRSINLVKRKKRNKHKRYLIEISDSSDFYENNNQNNFTEDENYISNSSISSSSINISNENINEKLHIKLSKLKSKTENEINCGFDRRFYELYENKRACKFIDNHIDKCKLCRKKNQEVINSVIKYYSTNSINQIRNFQSKIDLGEKRREKEKTNIKSNREIKSHKSDSYFVNDDESLSLKPIKTDEKKEHNKNKEKKHETINNNYKKINSVKKIEENYISSSNQTKRKLPLKEKSSIEISENSSLNSIDLNKNNYNNNNNILQETSSFSGLSFSSLNESFINFNYSQTNSAKSFSSAKTLVQFEKMNQLSDSESNKQDKKSVVSPSSIEKLKLQTVIDSVGFLLFPSSKFVNMAFKELLTEYNLFDLFQQTFKNESAKLFSNIENNSQLYSQPNEQFIERSVAHLFEINKNQKHDLKSFVIKLGSVYFKHLFADYEKSLMSIGDSIQSFFNNLSSLHESLLKHPEFGTRFLYLNGKFTGFAPSFRADLEPDSEQNILNVFVIQEKKTAFLNNFYFGLIESATKLIWNLDVQIKKLKNAELRNSCLKLDESSFSFVFGYRITLKSLNQSINFISNELNLSLLDFDLNSDLVKSTFPFTIQIDRDLNIVQFGDSLVRHLGSLILSGYGLSFLTYFSIETPKLNDYSFESLVINQNNLVVIKIKLVDSQCAQLKDMEIKGSIVYESVIDCILFLGSPIISSLEQLTDRGLYISDIPIHDAVRDIILVGEQTKAQEGLKFRMEKLKKSIIQANEDIEKEKLKNIELLNMIFPSEIAEKLWMGQKVNAHNVENVTLLYSDIVGFTSICSSSEPIEIVKMLKNIYTEFDNFCGLVDVYKIETIGDAYIVAAGLHKTSKYHAQRAAWMSLLMIDAASKSFTTKNEKINMRIGLHTGDVLAGIVGIKQPRYCLFGNNCTIANKFESTSEENRIHVSPVTKRLLDTMSLFEMEPRSSSYLPENWKPLSEIKEITWFLNDYKHINVLINAKCIDHIKAALLDLDEKL